MNEATSQQVEQQHIEWELERLAAEARDSEAAGSQPDPGAERLHSRLHEIGSDFGLFRR